MCYQNWGILLFTTLLIFQCRAMIIDTSIGGGKECPGSLMALRHPLGISFDSLEDVFVVDRGFSRILKLQPNGMVSRVAGNGLNRHEGDGGLAIYASLEWPNGLYVDSSNNIYIIQQSRIRRVFSNGTIETFAGNGTASFGGEGVLASKASVALHTSSNVPVPITGDSFGNIFFMERESSQKCRIRKILVDGTLVTVVGTGSVGYGGDGGPSTSALLGGWISCLITDILGNLILCDMNNYRIRKAWVNGTITTIAGNGDLSPASDGASATLAIGMVTAATLDRQGNIYFSEETRVRRILHNQLSTVAGNGSFVDAGDNGPATAAGLLDISAIGIDGSGNLYIAQRGTHKVRRVSTNQTIQTVLGTGQSGSWCFGGDGGAAESASLSGPFGMVMDSLGNLFIADARNHRIRKVRTDGIILTVAGNGSPSFGGDGGLAVLASFYFPVDVSVDDSGNLLIADLSNHRIRRVFSNGTVVTVAGNGTRTFGGDFGPATRAALNFPYGVAADKLGSFYISDKENHRIRRVSASGIITTVAGNGSSTLGLNWVFGYQTSLESPRSVLIDPDGKLYISEAKRVRLLFPNGTITTFAGTGIIGFGGDQGPAISANFTSTWRMSFGPSGSMYIVDSHRVRQVLSNGNIQTVCGNSSAGNSGDGGPLASALLNNPISVLWANEILFIADSENNVIRQTRCRGFVSEGNCSVSYSWFCRNTHCQF